MSKFLLACFSFVFVSFLAMAQDRVVQGKVTSVEDGVPLPGVNVVVKGTTNGAVTDADGAYKLSVPSNGGTLVFSFIGMVTQEVEIGERTVVDISMASDATQLSEVIVTSQGIAKDKKALGYAVSSVGSEQLEARPVNDISRVLQGKIPGVVIGPTGGTSGVGSSINIRGFSSLTGSTQPLWVVDGVPFNSSTNNSSGFTTGGAATATSRFLDLDPNTIASVNVLKGMAATVLYGDQGRNGVIMVTTKAGSAKKATSEVSFQQSYSVTEIASLPEYQNNYGNGFQQLSGVSPVFFSNWGAHVDEIDSAGHPFQFLGDATLRDAFPEYYYERLPYEATLDPSKLFRKGNVHNTSVSLTGGTDKLGYSASLAYTSEEGYLPGNDVKRLNISTGFNAAVTDKLTIRWSLMYANTDLTTPPLNAATGGGGTLAGPPSMYANFLYAPRNVDIFSMPFETPGEHKQVYYRGGNDIPNPLWMIKYMKDTDVTDRFFNSANINYDFNDKMSVSYKVGFDYYTQNLTKEYNKGIGAAYVRPNNGIYQTQSITNYLWNHDIIFSLSQQLATDLSLTARIGANARNDRFVRNGLYSEGQSVFGLMKHSNFSSASSTSVGFDGRVFDFESEQQRYGVYGDFQLDYKSFLFLNLSGRNDWSSSLEKANNHQFYPSASASFVVTDAFSSLKSDKLNFLKIRAGYGSSAGFGNIYSTRSIVGQNLRGYMDAGGALYGEHTIGNALGNVNLKPELQQEIELGFEAKGFNNRVGVDFTVYNRFTKDLITFAPVDPASGYTGTFINIGKLENKGIELGLTGTPVRSGDFSWDVILNFTVVRPKVVDLGTSIEEILLAGLNTRGNYAIAGQPTNIIKGSAIALDPDGNRIVRNADGLYELDPNNKILGDPNAKSFTTLINTVSYKGIFLSFQWDYRHGGKMYASTPSAVIGRGITKDTDFNRDLTFILPGVKRVDANDDGVDDGFIQNDIQVSASDYGFNTQFFGYQEVGMFDATNIRLREVSLSYVLPKTWLSKTPFKSASITLNGNNLWFNAPHVPKYVNFDPEVSSQGVDNGLGIDYLTGPSVRRYGAVIKFTL